MNSQVVVCQVAIVERMRQEELKARGKFTYTCADREIGHAECFAVLLEEIGEVAEALEPDVKDPEYLTLVRAMALIGSSARRALNLKRLANDPDQGRSHKPDRELKKELIQSFAVLMAWLEGFEEKSI